MSDPLLDHLRTHTCLPFPAGPLVPRQATTPAGDDEFGPTPRQRAQLAIALMRSSLREPRGRKHNPKSTLTRRILEAALAFQGRHPAMPLGRSEDDVAQQLLTTLTRLSDSADSLLVEAYGARFRTMCVKNDDAPLPAQVPWRGDRYRCACHPAKPASTPAERLPSGPAHYVDTVLAIPQGEWLLLGLFFLKQLHSHFAWSPNSIYSPNAALQFYGPVMQVLRHLARRRLKRAWSDAAAGLLLGLPRLGPYLAPDSEKAWIATSPIACFRADEVGDPAFSARQARRAFRDRGELEALSEDVDALAREVAARLTDPTQALAQGQHPERRFKYLLYAYTEQLTELNQQVSMHTENEQHTGQAMPQAAALLRDQLQPQACALLAYTTWMSKHGLEILRQQASASHPHP